MKRRLPLLVVFVAVTGLVMAQRFGRGFWGGGEGGGMRGDARTAREIPSHSTGTPMWENRKGFEKDVFTFSRVRYSPGGRFGGYYGRRGGGWATDLPDSDLNLSYRLQQMTSMKCSPDGRIIELTDPDLFEYPWIYIVEPGGFGLTDPEVAALRKYLLNGGFLMFDDFWGEAAWLNVEREMKRVFPERSFAELPLDHPLYTCVFQIKSKGQVPNVRTGEESQYTGVTWEMHDGDTRTVHHRAIHDDKGRMMVFAAHNTDNGDGWEREGEYEYYFKNFSERIAYPLGINVVFYAMTH
ncbi:MAG: DUF4159 domain-containing protein [Verrucomicrobia bacterium]|nr:DUF4159 domain-containing protein [Verrucomicrobiota bacterium]